MMALAIALAVLAVGITCALAFRVYQELPYRVLPHRFLCVAMGLYYGAGTLVGLARLSPMQLDEALGRNGATETGLIQALILVLLFILLVEGVCTLGVKAFAWRASDATRHLDALAAVPRFAFFAWTIMGVQVLLVATGKLGFSGFQLEEGSSRISPVAALVRPLALGLILLSGYGLARRDHRLMRLTVLGLQLAVFLLSGRRMFVIALGLFLAGFLLARPARALKWQVLSVSLVVAVGVFPVFFAMRMAQYDRRDKPTLAERAEYALQIMRTGSGPGDRDFWEQLKENVESRPFIIGYLASLCSRPGHYTGAGGKVTLGALATAVPSSFLPSKDRLMAWGMEEGLAYREMGMHNIEDEAETILTSGYVDARESGVLLAALGFMAWLWIMRFLFLSCPVPEVAVGILGATLMQCLNVEDGLAAFFVVLRNTAMLCVAAYAFHLVSPPLHTCLATDSQLSHRSGEP